VGLFAVDAPRKANADQRGIDRIGIGEETFAWGNFVHWDETLLRRIEAREGPRPTV
jgi:hypothetical protein